MLVSGKMDPLDISPLKTYITDLSAILTTEENHEIEEQLAFYQKQTTEEIAVLLFPHRRGQELFDIGLKVFNETGLGNNKQNNGLLLIIVTEEKKIRIVVGKGLEIKYSEMVCRDIIENHLRSLLNNEEYSTLIKTWINIISNRDYKVANVASDKPQGSASYTIIEKFGLYLVFGFCLFIAIWITLAMLLSIYVTIPQEIFFSNSYDNISRVLDAIGYSGGMCLLATICLIIERSLNQTWKPTKDNSGECPGKKEKILLFVLRLLFISHLIYGVGFSIATYASSSKCHKEGEMQYCEVAIREYSWQEQHAIRYSGGSSSYTHNGGDNDNGSSSSSWGGGSSNGGGYGD